MTLVRRHSWWAVVLAATLVSALPDCGLAGEPALGSIAKLRFKDVWYLPRSLGDLGDAQAYVIVTGTLDCQRFAGYLPELKRLAEEYSPRDVKLIVLDVGQHDTIRQIAAQSIEHELPFPSVKDIEGKCVAELGVETTCTAVVLDREHRIRYRGRIDDRFEHGDASDSPKQRPLRNALDEVLAGGTVTRGETPVSGTAIAPFVAIAARDDLTFAADVEPILRAHCQRCHRPGSAAPFSLLDYDDAAGQAEMLAEVVAEERMPPWYAAQDTFANHPTITAEQRLVLRQWVAADCPPGDLSQIPPADPAPTTPDGWQIDEPDLVIEVPRAQVLPSEGYIPYKYLVLPYLFREDTFISQCEIRSDNPRVLHHCNMYYFTNPLDPGGVRFIFGKVPGAHPLSLEDGTAMRIPRGAMLGLQVHYTTTGEPERCQIQIGFRYPRGKVERELHTLWVMNTRLRIPAGAALHRETAKATFEQNAIGVGVFAHMHLRGRHMSFLAHRPDGSMEELLNVPNYSFDWQLIYDWPTGEQRFAKGTTIECISHYDNSAFNPYNPDPKATVLEGQQTTQEMLNGVLFYLDADPRPPIEVDPATGFAKQP